MAAPKLEGSQRTSTAVWSEANLSQETKSFDQNYIRIELDALGKALKAPLRLHVAGGYVMASLGLKAGTKDIDVIVETNAEALTLGRALTECGYRKIPINDVGGGYQGLGALIYENKRGFRWDIFTLVVAGKLSLTEGMKARARPGFTTGRISLTELSREDIFLMKGVTDRDRDLDDMALIARSDLNYDIVYGECLVQSDKSDVTWEAALSEKCSVLEERNSIKIPIGRKLRRAAEEKMLKKAIISELRKQPMTDHMLQERFRGKLNKRDIAAGLKILLETQAVRMGSDGKFSIAEQPAQT